MLKEFKEFAMKGNVLDMAVGIIVGASFSPIVKSLVDDIIMPPIGFLVGDVDFTNLFLVLREGSETAPYRSLEAAREVGAVTVNYGAFLNTVVTFLIVTFAVFLLVRGVNRMRRQQPQPEPAPTEKSCTYCFTTIPLKATRCPHCTSQLEAAAG